MASKKKKLYWAFDANYSRALEKRITAKRMSVIEKRKRHTGFLVIILLEEKPVKLLTLSKFILNSSINLKDSAKRVAVTLSDAKILAKYFIQMKQGRILVHWVPTLAFEASLLDHLAKNLVSNEKVKDFSFVGIKRGSLPLLERTTNEQ